MKINLKTFSILVLFTFFMTSCQDFMKEHTTINDSISTRATNFDVSGHYWQHGEKIPLQKMDKKFYVMFYTAKEDKQKTEFSKAGIDLIDEREVSEFRSYSIDMTDYGENARKLNNYKTATIEGNHEQIVSSMPDILYWSPYYRMANGLEIGITNLFFVELKPDIDIEQLEQLAEKYSVHIIGADNSLKGWYYIACNNSSRGNALEMANLFYESGLFLESCPDFFGAGSIDCINEPMFTTGALWHLGNNMTNPSIHINYCSARSIISQGSSIIKVAVIDSGVETSHSDLYNILPGWDAETGTAPNFVSHSHGTSVSGFIGAIPNNYSCVAGIAYGVQILPVSFRVNSLGSITSSSTVMRDAINYAVSNGASIINCSWHYGNPIVGAAIADALNNGCIVVFASGNTNSAVTYPANSDARILVVGAINENGQRWYNSNYDNALDIVAPGEYVASTSTSNGIMIGSGTSLAAPQAAAVAALIRSINPHFKPHQVTTLIEKTAKKLPSYPFSFTRPNGTWDSQVGYGLLNAYEAVKAALPVNRTINLGFHYHGGPVDAYCDGTPLSSGSSRNYSATNYTGYTISQTISVPNGYIIELQEEPRGDYVLTGNNTSNLHVTYDLFGEGSSVSSLVLKFTVR